ncbi:MAG: DUF1439 domain-containing protein [Pseudomonadota bacterium]
MKKIVVVSALILCTMLGAGYWYLSGKDFFLYFTEAQLQEKLNAKLPLTKTYLMIFNITLDKPKLHLVNGSNKIQMGLDVAINLNVVGEAKFLGGMIEVSGGVAYVPENAQFFLIDPVVENLAVAGMPQKHEEKVRLALSKALATYYAGHPLYQLKSTDTKQAAAKLVLKSVVVENQQLVLKMGI